MIFLNTDIDIGAKKYRKSKAAETVTAIVPHWGDPKPLARALASIAAQTVPVAKTIVIDDASPSKYRAGIEACVEEIRNKGLSVCLLVMPQNSGPAAARNLGWDAARTEHIAFLDNDDVWHPEKIARQTAFMRETGAHFCAHVYCHNRPMELLRDDSLVYGFHQFLLRNRVSTPTVMVRRDVSIRFPATQRRSEDYALWLRLVKQAPMPFLNAELARGFKKPWGEAGLSADMKAMLEGQIQTYQSLHQDGLIGRVLVRGLLLWSRVRYLRRLLRLRINSVNSRKWFTK